MKTKSLENFLEGLKKFGVKAKKVNPTHVAELYKGKTYLGTVIRRKGIHMINWGNETPVIKYFNLIHYTLKSGYIINFYDANLY